MNIGATFHWNPSTKYGDTASREIGINEQWTDTGQTTGGCTDDRKSQCLLLPLVDGRGMKTINTIRT